MNDASPDSATTAAVAPIGRRAFLAGVAGTAAATALNSRVDAASVPSGASYFQPVRPVRLADTRTSPKYAHSAKKFERLSSTLSRIKIIDSPYATDVPANAIAVVVSIAAIYNGTDGWVAALPTGSSRVVSNINIEAGDGAVANLATVKIGVGGKIDVRSRWPGDVVVDILGVYVATSDKVRAGRMQFLPTTRRVLRDTRMTPGLWRTIELPFLSTRASAVVVNLTVARCRTVGWLAASSVRSASRPKVSNLNYVAGDERAAAAIVQLGVTSGNVPKIEIYSNGDAQVYVDVTGFFTGESDVASEDGLFVPITPNRVMDTRRAFPDFAASNKKRLFPGWTRPFELPVGGSGFGQKNQMKGVAMNATLAGSLSAGYVTVLPAQTPRQNVSNLNPTRVGHTVANHVITEVSEKGAEFYARCGGDVIADIAGWYVGSPKPVVYSNPTPDPPPPFAPFNWYLNVPAMRGSRRPNGVQNFVVPHANGDIVVDSGNTWHWTNTGLLGDDAASIVLFGHRTSKGGPFRYQHNLVANDRLYLDTPDQRRYEFRMISERITGDDPLEILAGARASAPRPSISLVACTGSSTIRDDQPRGGIRYRLITTFALVGWIDTRPHI